MGLKRGFGHFFGKKQLPYLENCKTISHIMIVMTVNSTFYYITGGKGSASFVCEIGLNIESCWNKESPIDKQRFFCLTWKEKQV